MKRVGIGFLISVVVAGALAVAPRSVGTQSLSPEQRTHVVAITPSTLSEIRSWDAELTRMQRDGTLQLVREHEDTLMPGRQHERMAQYHNGIRVFGAEVTRQSESGVPISMLGSIYGDVDVPAAARLSREEAREVMLGQPNAQETVGSPELLVLPLDAGGFALAYRIVTVFPDDILVSFVDADSGRILMQFTDLQTQANVGTARGVLADTKKISTNLASGTYQASDLLRPSAILTYDLKGNVTRVNDVLAGRATLGPADLAVDTDNSWTDGAVVDGHVYAGWTYDYYFKRFGRRGLNNNNLAIRSIIHPVPRDSSIAFINANSQYFTNAFWSGSQQLMVYGVGLPPNITSGGQTWNFVSGALDIVAHELTHGVTQFTSGLIYRNESGALNEAFSDIMATGAEFFFQEAGSGPLRADYLAGEDVVTGGGNPGGGIRSLANPVAYGDPDHYATRSVSSGDSGGVHINSGIANHAFYLAIEGGTNRTSGLAVQGVGGANRDQIEKVFYRAFTSMLPANSNFYLARVATIQSAVDLYGANSAAVRATTQGWDAVGVTRPAARLRYSFSAVPVPPAPATQCLTTVPRPAFRFQAFVEEIAGVGFNVTSSSIRFYSAAGAQTSTQAISFSAFFNACSPGSSRIGAYAEPCTDLCVGFGGAAGGFMDFTIAGVDDAGNAASFTSGRLPFGTTTALTSEATSEPTMCLAATGK